MMLEACGGILTHNGGSYRVSLTRGDLAGTQLLSSTSDSSQISPSGRVMTRKRLWELMEILHHGRLGMLLRTLFGSHANLPPNYRDGSWESNIRMLTGTIKVDWIQLPVEQYLAALPTLKQGVIAGVFRQKGAAPWGITRAEKLQLSVHLSLEDWYAGVYGLPTVWPEASMLGADNLRKVAGYDFHLLRKKYDVRSMWGDLDPQWRLLQSQLETRGPGWYSPVELKERLFTNKSKRPGDDTKEALRTDGNTTAWQAWYAAQNLIWQSCQPAPQLS